jgi:hypothetical protein
MYWSVALLSAVGAYGSGGQFVLEGGTGSFGFSLSASISLCASCIKASGIGGEVDSADLRAP